MSIFLQSTILLGFITCGQLKEFNALLFFIILTISIMYLHMNCTRNLDGCIFKPCLTVVLKTHFSLLC